MDLVLVWKLNKRNIRLYQETHGQTIGVLRHDGSYGYKSWRGFMSRAEAAESGGKPVKLQVARIGYQDGFDTKWHEVRKVAMSKAASCGAVFTPMKSWC